MLGFLRLGRRPKPPQPMSVRATVSPPRSSPRTKTTPRDRFAVDDLPSQTSDSGSGGGGAFKVRTRIAKAAGPETRFASAAIRVLPSPPARKAAGNGSSQHGVILQATDGRQAVCVLAPGSVQRAELVPLELLPSRQSAGALIHLEGNTWRSSEGKSAPRHQNGTGVFPRIGDVLPAMQSEKDPAGVLAGSHRQEPFTMLGLDVELLKKIADSLGTSKLTLFIKTPEPDRKDTSGVQVNKPVAVCPADSSGVDGVAVIMPLMTEHKQAYYESIRRQVVEAEKRLQPPEVSPPSEVSPLPEVGQKAGNGRNGSHRRVPAASTSGGGHG